MIDLVLRNAIIFTLTIVMYVSLQNIPGNITGSVLVLPILITLAPVIFARLPIMGTRDLVLGRMPPFVSSVVFIGLALVYPMLVEFAERKDPVKQMFAREDVEFGGMKFSVKTLTLLALIVLTELILQFQYSRFMLKRD